MDPVALTIGLSWTIGGLLCAALAVPLVRGRVKPNVLYGVRFAQSFQSDDAWYAINRFGGKRMLVWSAPMIAAGVVAFFLPLRSHTALTFAAGLGPLIFVLIPTLESWRFARRYRLGDERSQE